MKHVLLGMIFLSILSCQEQKIGFVDNVKLMNDYQEKIDIEKKYQTRSETFTKRRDSISQAFQLEAQAFQEKAQQMSQQKAQEEYGNLQQRGQQIGQLLQQQEQQLQQEGQVEMDSLITKVREQIKTFGKNNGYSFILGSGTGGSVLYGEEAKDLTGDILKLLNETYKN